MRAQRRRLSSAVTTGRQPSRGFLVVSIDRRIVCPIAFHCSCAGSFSVAHARPCIVIAGAFCIADRLYFGGRPLRSAPGVINGDFAMHDGAPWMSTMQPARIAPRHIGPGCVVGVNGRSADWFPVRRRAARANRRAAHASGGDTPRRQAFALQEDQSPHGSPHMRPSLLRAALLATLLATSAVGIAAAQGGGGGGAGGAGGGGSGGAAGTGSAGGMSPGAAPSAQGSGAPGSGTTMNLNRPCGPGSVGTIGSGAATSGQKQTAPATSGQGNVGSTQSGASTTLGSGC